MKEKEILKCISTAIEKHVPDTWEDLKNKLIKEKSSDSKTNDASYNINYITKRKEYLRKISIAVAACIIIVTTLAFTPAFAYIQNGIGKLLDKGYHDKGVNSAIENGIGQVIDQSSTNSDITVTLDAIISDQNRTAFLLSLYSDVYDLRDSTIGQIDITDENGKIISNGGIMRYSYDNLNNTRNIVYIVNSLNEYVDHNINVRIHEINAYTIKDEDTNIDTGIVLYDKNIYDLSEDIKDNIPFIDSFTIVKYEVINNKVNVEYEYKIKEENKDNAVFFKLIYEEENKLEVINEKVVPQEDILNNDGTSVQIDEKYLTYKAYVGYSIESSNLLSNGIKLFVQYYDGNAVTGNIKGNWTFNFGLNKTSTDSITLKNIKNKDFVINNTKYKIKYVVFSPSETRVYITASNDSPVLETKDMSINMNNEVKKCYQYFKDQDGYQVYCFDPITGNGKVLLKIDESITISLIE